MFLIWGTKKVTSKQGFVAEECPRCRTVTKVKVSRIGLASHIYYISLGRGRLLGFTGECPQCSEVFEVQPTDYAAFEKRKKSDLNALIEKTNPRLLPNNKSAAESFRRFSQLRDPLLRVNQSLVERYARGTRIDWPGGLALLATFVVPISIGIAISSMTLSEVVKERIGEFAIGLFVAGLIASVVVLYTEPKRYFRKTLLSDITGSLKPLDPQRTELDSCLAALKKFKYPICSFVTGEDLLKGVRGM